MNMPAQEQREETRLIGHQKKELWMGAEYLTLSDLWPQNPRAILVGINPTDASVRVGHYYQGLAGRRMFRMLHDAGVLESRQHKDVPGLYDDDLALSQGIGFTDLVKRPSRNAQSLKLAELEFGAQELDRNLRTHASPLVIFVFKKTAQVLFGTFEGIGLLGGLEIGGARCFVMPHYSARVPLRDVTLAQLKRLWNET
ncbi:TDG/mug DNA glycosylase family protein [Arthrobacter sp. B2I5]|uniref:uracil-DNA glycosylase family protein n=1 Tax=Arthrobacter sp. B2I5 TaxID=3042266 RepID=UPI002781BF7F|nr:uracil-DNA glycosylase family protein [Arthrobacter sp. B2I5]MDQ0826914.1 TDG/mug DNA glycosylase family protein [Arthrobacter sp. B2I5]